LWHVSIPLVGVVASPYLLGLRQLPVINAVRAVTAVRTALPFVGSCLAGLGLAALLRPWGPVARRTLGAVVLVAAIGEIFFSRSGELFGFRFRARFAAPAPAFLALLDTLPPGPVLDYPPSKYPLPIAHYVFLHGFHDHPIDACYSSFPSPMGDEVYTMSAQLPNSLAALRLRTLGFRSIVVHGEHLGADLVEKFTRWAEHDGRYAGLRRIGEADGHIAYAFRPAPPTDGFDALTLPRLATWPGVQTLDTSGVPLRFDLHNYHRRFYRHPDPIRPQPVVLTWRDEAGVERASDTRTTLLPLALIPDGTQRVKVVPAIVPPPGTYTVTMHRGDAQGPMLAALRVVIAG
jgi:hypothetical protein